MNFLSLYLFYLSGVFSCQHNIYLRRYSDVDCQRLSSMFESRKDITAPIIRPPFRKPVARPTIKPVAVPTIKPVAVPTIKPVAVPTIKPVANNSVPVGCSGTQGATCVKGRATCKKPCTCTNIVDFVGTCA